MFVWTHKEKKYTLDLQTFSSMVTRITTSLDVDVASKFQIHFCCAGLKVKPCPAWLKTQTEETAFIFIFMHPS